MSFFGAILLAIFIWVMYNFVTKLVLPVYFTSKRIKEQFNNIRQQQDAAYNQNKSNEQYQAKQQEQSAQKVGEYIDFEEVK